MQIMCNGMADVKCNIMNNNIEMPNLVNSVLWQWRVWYSHPCDVWYLTEPPDSPLTSLSVCVWLYSTHVPLCYLIATCTWSSCINKHTNLAKDILHNIFFIYSVGNIV